MVSNVKKNHVLKHIMQKFNQQSQDVTFVMGMDGMPLYRPITTENAEGQIEQYTFIDEASYVTTKEQYVPVALLIDEPDFAQIQNIARTDRISSVNWSVTVEFLVFTGSYVHNKLVFAIEEFRDKFLSHLDFIEVKQYDYDNTSAKPTTEYFLVTSHTGGVKPSGLVTINGIDYLSYTMSIDLEISKDLTYGNQFEFYISAENDGLGDPIYERVLPLQVSWGVGNTLDGDQLLNSSDLTADDLRKARMIHNIVTSRGFGITFTFMFDPSRDVIRQLFKETYNLKEVMNNPIYKIRMRFMEKDFSGETPTFVESTDILFDYDCLIGDDATEVVYGDNVLFTIGFSPSWLLRGE